MRTTRALALAAGLLVALAGCGGGGGGEGGASADAGTDAGADGCAGCDTVPAGDATGADAGPDGTEDAAPDAQPPSCGDGVRQPGEGCDDGEANAEGARCRPDCTVDVAVACAGAGKVWDLAALGATGAGPFRLEGTTDDLADDHAPPAGCLDPDGAGPHGPDGVLVLHAGGPGAWVVTTDFPGTLPDTVLYRLHLCDAPVPKACNDQAKGALAGGSTLVVEADGPGPIFVALDVRSPLRGPWAAEVRRLDGLAGEGEPCGGGVACRAPAVCSPVPGGPTCLPDAAPQLDDLGLVRLGPDPVRHVLSGVDPNHDVEALVVEEIERFQGASIGPFEVLLGEVAWDGDAFVTEVVLSGIGELGARAVTASLRDAAGGRSAPVTRDYPAWVAPPEVEAGEACDPARLASVCAAPTACTVAPGGEGGTCGDPAPPTLDAVGVERVSADGLLLALDGSDPNADVVSLAAEYLTAEGAVDLSLLVPLVDSVGRATFGLEAELDGLPVGAGVAEVRVWLVDAAGLASAPETFAVPVPAEASAGGACDEAGAEVACAGDLVCGADAFGDRACEAAEPPATWHLEATWLEGGEAMGVAVVGADPNGDVTALELVARGLGGLEGSVTVTRGGLRPDPFGRVAFALDTAPVGAQGAAFREVEVRLRDATGRLSAPRFDPLHPEGAAGAACSPDGLAGACDNDEGLTCGGSATCEPAAAPGLAKVRVRRPDAKILRLELSGTDPNADVVGWRLAVLDAAGAPVAGLGDPGPEALRPLEAEVWGQVAYEAVGVLADVTAFPGAAALRVEAVDDARLASGALEVPIPTFADEGEPCDLEEVTTLCTKGLSCDAGTCAPHPPALLAASAAQSGALQTVLEVTVSGKDPDRDVTKLLLTFLDAAGTPALPTVEVPLDGLAWDAGATFTRTVPLPGWSGPAVHGLAKAQARLSDVYDQKSSPLTFSFRPTVGEGDPCDEAAVDALCDAGTFCDAAAGLCAVDPDAPCGAGVGVVDVLAAGAPVAGGWLLDAVIPPGPGSFGGSCAAASGGSGEVVARFPAPGDGLLRVTTDLPGASVDTVLHARVGGCSDPSAEVACNDDGPGTGQKQSTILVPLEAGEVAWVFLDSYEDEGAVEALFAFGAVGGPGEPCVPQLGPAACEEGLLCKPAGEVALCDYPVGTCAKPLNLGLEGAVTPDGLGWTLVGTLAGQADVLSAPCGKPAGQDAMLVLTPPASGTLTVQASAAYKLALTAYVGACGPPGQLLGCNNGLPNDPDPTLEVAQLAIPVSEDVPVWIALSAFQEQFFAPGLGAWTLTATLAPAP